MIVTTSRGELAAARNQFARLGFVPTMGFLHEGHLSLVRTAKRECGAVAVSIFVNPLQFGPTEDLAAYPRALERDLALLQDAGADLVWTPTESDMYAAGFSTSVEVSGLTRVLEGARRPDHFRGVTTVVAILLNAMRPERAYFGQKDAQQLAVIRKMVHDLAMPVEVVGHPTVREPDGLAMSSRNAYLSADERRAATVLYRALTAVTGAWQDGETDANRLRAVMTAILAAEPLARPEYASIAHPDTLEELDRVDTQIGALASLAVTVGTPTLLDNMVLAARPVSQ